MVMVDRTVALPGYDTVRVDDAGLAHRAVAHLCSHGHRRIAFVGSDERFETTRDRLTGYRRALADVGVEPRPELVRPGPTRDVDGAAVTEALLALPEPPTAVFAANPRAAIGVAHALHTGDRADVAFVSFGDFPLADHAATRGDRGRPEPGGHRRDRHGDGDGAPRRPRERGTATSWSRRS